MIKFFRKIRQQLLTENKFSRYLIYAIGEIILVVIGILIALQFNNWNIDRKSELKAEELSENLLQELKGVKNLMDHQLEDVERQRNAIQYVINNDEPQLDSVLSLAYLGSFQVDPLSFLFSYIVYFNPRGDIYNSAINDGTLVLIQSVELIKGLNTVYTMSENRWSEHVKAENSVNIEIQAYIADKYHDLFNSGELKNNKGDWDKTTTNKILQAINSDGRLKYLLSAKLQILRFKHASLNRRVYPVVELSIDYFENNRK